MIAGRLFVFLTNGFCVQRTLFQTSCVLLNLSCDVMVVHTCSVFFLLNTEACRVWGVAPGVCSLSELRKLWPQGKLANSKTDSCFKCLQFVNNLPHCRRTDSKLFWNVLIILPRLTSRFWLLMPFLHGIVLNYTWRLQNRTLPKHLLLKRCSNLLT